MCVIVFVCVCVCVCVRENHVERDLGNLPCLLMFLTEILIKAVGGDMGCLLLVCLCVYVCVCVFGCVSRCLLTV